MKWRGGERIRIRTIISMILFQTLSEGYTFPTPRDLLRFVGCFVILTWHCFKVRGHICYPVLFLAEAMGEGVFQRYQPNINVSGKALVSVSPHPNPISHFIAARSETHDSSLTLTSAHCM